MDNMYQNPLVHRYASSEMSSVWSMQTQVSNWRKLWISLAQAEKELGIDITDEQINQMKEKIDDIDFDYAKQKEKELRHDVMAHIHTFGHQAPLAMPIIHLGATSCFVADNSQILQLRDSMKLIKSKLLKVIDVLNNFAMEHKDLPCLGFTHFQPAQLVTVGKRAGLWLQDFVMDLEELDTRLDRLQFRGVKGTTGTQASFLRLFNGDSSKVTALDKRVAELMGFDQEKLFPLSGQTYTRKMDFQVLSVLSAICQSAYKLAGDIRLLMSMKEIDEPFASAQVGSSAMPYKRNPMRSERICSLSRFVMSLPANCAGTHSSQWFERTLDDSANRRIVLPEAFLATDVVLSLVANVCSGLVIWPKVISARVMSELPFMATENILMECVKAGGDRQDLHERIREHAFAAGGMVKGEGKPNDLMERLAKDEAFIAVKDRLAEFVNPHDFIGRCKEQVEEYNESVVKPLLESNKAFLNTSAKDKVLL